MLWCEEHDRVSLPSSLQSWHFFLNYAGPDNCSASEPVNHPPTAGIIIIIARLSLLFIIIILYCFS